jgi:hypothetical protein
MNFYQFRKKKGRVKSGIHYQNRPVPFDYVTFFEESDLTIEVQKPIFDSCRNLT